MRITNFKIAGLTMKFQIRAISMLQKHTIREISVLANKLMPNSYEEIINLIGINYQEPIFMVGRCFYFTLCGIYFYYDNYFFNI